jgi:hypothetical protein
MSDVQLGQRYRQVNPPQDVWEVVAILSTAGPIPHARLMRRGDPKDTKTVSVPALQDRKLFELLQ